MNNVLSFGPYRAEFGYDPDADLLHGRVLGINAVVDFYGKDVTELKQEFKNSIEEYVDYCQQKGIRPEKTWAGKLTIRPNEEQRRRFVVAAALARKSVSAWMTDVLDQASRKAEEEVVPVD